MTVFAPSEVKDWLEWAGQRMLVMSVGRTKPAGYRVYWPDFAPDPIVAYGYHNAQARLSKPSAREIPVVDEILGLVVVIPDRTRRRIVSSRALVRPVSGRPIFGWQRLGRLLHVDSRTIKRLHAKGLQEICDLGPEAKMRQIASFMAAGAL